MSSNYKEVFLADAVVEGVEVVLKGDSLVTEQFDLHAETTKDSTAILLTTSDMDFDFRSPKNLFAVIDDFTRVAQTAQQQIESHDINLNLLKEVMPETTLRANIGNQNPISKFLFMQGFRYKELVQCYEHAAASNITATDDTALAEELGIEVFLAKGSYSNIKITTPEDIAVAYEIIRSRGELEPFED
jgi:hypothetical protein